MLRRWRAPGNQSQTREYTAITGALIALALVVGATSTAFAQEGGGLDGLSRDDQRKFERLADECLDAYDAGRYQKAEDKCVEARGITPHPMTYYVEARIRDKTNKCEPAVELYNKILNDTPAGQAEQKFVDDYREKATGFLEALGDCSARFEVACKDKNAVVVTANAIAKGCPVTVAGNLGTQEIWVVAPGKAPKSLSAEGIGGKVVPVDAGSLKAAPDQGASVDLDCAGVTAPTAVYEGGKLIGTCPDTLSLSPGKHLLEIRGADGSRALALVNADPAVKDQKVSAALVRTVTLNCHDPSVQLQLQNEMVDIQGTCGELASGVELPDGEIVARLGDPDDGVELPLNVDGGGLTIPALDAVPVEVTVTCADADEPPVYVKIGDEIGRCPFTATVNVGKRAVEARREGFDPWSAAVAVNHKDNTVAVPALEPKTFFTPGVITAISGGAILLSAVIVDGAGAGTLDEFKAISDGDISSCGLGDTATQELVDACYNDRKDSVETTILLTRILYGAGLGVALVGGGLIIYELFANDPNDFASEVTAGIRVAPAMVSGTDGPGLVLDWRF